MILFSLIGMPLETAKAEIQEEGLRVRLTAIDGEAMIGTRDWRTDRVNLTVVNGIVTEAKLG